MGKILSFKNLFILSIILIMFLFLKDDGLIDYQRLANERNQLLSTIQDESNSLYFFNVPKVNIVVIKVAIGKEI